MKWPDFAAVAPLPRGWVRSPGHCGAFSWQRPCSVKTRVASAHKKDVVLYLLELLSPCVITTQLSLTRLSGMTSPGTFGIRRVMDLMALQAATSLGGERELLSPHCVSQRGCPNS